MFYFSRIYPVSLAVILLVSCFVVGTSQPAHAWHDQSGAVYTSKNCTGSHCTIVDLWSIAVLRGKLGTTDSLHATLSMDTYLDAPATGIPVNCEAGETVTIPIRASGEIIGAGEAFYDSPPIYFLTNGIVRAITEGINLASCGAAANNTAACYQPYEYPLEGTWRDTWGASVGVSCSSNAAGDTATCIVPPSASGSLQAQLTRSVDNFIWTWAYYAGALAGPAIDLRPGGSLALYPARMTSTAELTCSSSQVPNLTITNATFSPTAPAHNDPLSVTATVSNTGTDSAGPSVTRVRFDTDANGSWDIGPFDVNTSTVSAQAALGAVWPNIWSAPGGTHRMEVCADATNTVAESNETDNCRTVSFTVRKTGLACAPATQTVIAGQVASLTGSGGNNRTPYYNWLAPGGTPASGGGLSFATSYAATGAKTVGVIEYFVDVNGDGLATDADTQLVMSNVGGVSPGSGARWQNQTNRYDVNGDGAATRLDAQIVNDYAIAQSATPLPTVNCAVTVDPGTTGGGGDYDPVPESLCTPLTVNNLAINQSVTFRHAYDEAVAWTAVGGTPASGAVASSFSTKYAAAGSYEVSVVPPAFYDVNGDGYITAFDYQAVGTKAAGGQVTTPPLTGGAWQNQTDPFDVNHDGAVTPMDALVVINYLNRYGSSLLPLTSCAVNVSASGTSTNTGPTAAFDVPATVTLNDVVVATSTSKAGTCSSGTCSNLTHLWQITRIIDDHDVTPSAKTGQTVSITADQVTQYRFTLTVTDDLQRQSTATKVVTVIGPTIENPLALCSPDQQTYTIGQTTPASFQSTIGNTASTWSAPDGVPASGTGAAFSTTYLTTGTKVVTVSALVPPYFDVNGDNTITEADHTELLAHIGGSAPGNGAAWQNQANRFDVGGDGSVTPVNDVLPLVNYLNATGGGPVPSRECRVEVQAGPVTPTPTVTITPTPTPSGGATTGDPFNPGSVREEE